MGQLAQSPWYQQPATVAAVIYTGLTLFIALFMAWQTHLQRNVLRMQVLFNILERLEKVRAERGIVRGWISKKRAELGTGGSLPVPPDDPAVVAAIDKVCREYDIVGLLERRGFLNRRLVDEFYSVPLAILWRDYLRSYVDDLRGINKRGPTHFWELDQFARRVEWVADNHPGLTAGKKRWRFRRRSKPRGHS